MLEQSAYKRLRNIYAERTQSVVFFVGSGPSTEVGLPSWTKLRHILEHELEAKAQVQQGAQKQELIATLDQIRGIPDPWVQFGKLQKAIGDASYVAAVRDALTLKDDTKTPSIFKQIWELSHVSGVVTLNLDGLVSRAFSQARPGKTLQELNGQDDLSP
jgi:hypothetical protein